MMWFELPKAKLTGECNKELFPTESQGKGNVTVTMRARRSITELEGCESSKEGLGVTFPYGTFQAVETNSTPLDGLEKGEC